MRLSNQVITISVLFTTFIFLSLFIYWPGLGGDFYLDAAANLQNIGNGSALEFIFSGAAGPSGRPLSLATFLITPDAFPDNPRPLRLINLAIHIFNSLLVFVFLALLGKSIQLDKSRHYLLAAICSVIWLIHPINSTVTLIAVQRMTSLSGTFLLLGLIAYLYGRLLITTDYRRGYWYLTLGVVFGGTLSVLSKENGILLPVFILVTESVLLGKYVSLNGVPYWKMWYRLMIITPCLLILAYILIKFPTYSSNYDIRPFSLSERLLTEPRVLIGYVSQILIPRAELITPFQDGYEKSTSLISPLSTGLSILLLFAVIVGAWFTRKKYPLYGFAVAWFLGGHLLESTVIPLELYYEHRNYVPLIGPVFALGVGLSRQTIVGNKAVMTIVAIWVALLLGVLYNTSLTWSKVDVAAEIWYQRSPDSKRAAQFLASKYAEYNDMKSAARILNESYERFPNSTLLALQLMKVNCAVQKVDMNLLSELKVKLRSTNFESTIGPVMENYMEVVRFGHCQGMSMSDVYDLLLSLMDNPNFQKSHNGLYNLNMLVSKVAVNQGKLGLAIDSLERAREINPRLSTIRVPAMLLMSAGLVQEAERHFELMDKHVPSNPIKKYFWGIYKQKLRSDLDVMKENIEREDERASS